jgi:hypothetical protein
MDLPVLPCGLIANLNKKNWKKRILGIISCSYTIFEGGGRKRETEDGKSKEQEKGKKAKEKGKRYGKKPLNP